MVPKIWENARLDGVTRTADETTKSTRFKVSKKSRSGKKKGKEAIEKERRVCSAARMTRLRSRKKKENHCLAPAEGNAPSSPKIEAKKGPLPEPVKMRVNADETDLDHLHRIGKEGARFGIDSS